MMLRKPVNARSTCRINTAQGCVMRRTSRAPLLCHRVYFVELLKPKEPCGHTRISCVQYNNLPAERL